MKSNNLKITAVLFIMMTVLMLMTMTNTAFAGNCPEISVKSYTGTGKVLVLWSAVDNSDGYKVYRSESAEGDYVRVKTIDGTKRRYVDSGLKIGKIYYYKVCAFTKTGDKRINGNLSACKQVKVLGVIKKDPKNKLMVANKNNKLSSKYIPTNLSSLSGYQVQSVYVKSYVKRAFIKLYNAAKDEGYTIKAVSGYRSYNLQKTLFANYAAADGVENAERYSARPGTSEHQTGLAIDVSTQSEGYGLEESFGKTPEGKWLASNSYKYGFIIRYPRNKESITGYLYEPWHIRFVGTKAAKEIYDSGKTLEEYMKY